VRGGGWDPVEFGAASDRAACRESRVVLDETPWMSRLRYTWTTVQNRKEAS